MRNFKLQIQRTNVKESILPICWKKKISFIFYSQRWNFWIYNKWSTAKVFVKDVFTNQ